MVEDPVATPSKPKRKGGRPSRAQASERALLGVDLTAVDPAKILRQIAADGSAPASARVAACRTLLEMKNRDSAEEPAVGDVARAIRLMAARKAAH
jgi:hypothetical protein